MFSMHMALVMLVILTTAEEIKVIYKYLFGCETSIIILDRNANNARSLKHNHENLLYNA